MTDYNDGKWYGFSGGKIPVHPHTEVECFFSDGVKNSGLAKEYSWETDPEWIAFRVIKPYREAREFWTYFDNSYQKWCISADEKYARDRHYPSGMTGEVTHVREVIPD